MLSLEKGFYTFAARFMNVTEEPPELSTRLLKILSFSISRVVKVTHHPITRSSNGEYLYMNFLPTVP